MNERLTYRAAGAAALVGGLLRIASPLAPRFGPDGAQLAYLTIDVLLMFGLLGFYARWAKALGPAGLLAFVGSVAGFLVVRSQGAVAGAYMLGASLLALGMAGLGARLLFVRGGSKLAPALWIAAVPVGLAGQQGLLVAGTLFALGYVVAGAELLRPR